MTLEERLISAYLRSLKSLEEFKAQEALEDRLFASYASKMLTLDLTDQSLGLEYARIRGAMDAIKQLKAVREEEVSKANQAKLAERR